MYFWCIENGPTASVSLSLIVKIGPSSFPTLFFSFCFYWTYLGYIHNNYFIYIIIIRLFFWFLPSIFSLVHCRPKIISQKMTSLFMMACICLIFCKTTSSVNLDFFPMLWVKIGLHFTFWITSKVAFRLLVNQVPRLLITIPIFSNLFAPNRPQLIH